LIKRLISMACCRPFSRPWTRSGPATWPRELAHLFERLKPKVVFAQLDYGNLIAGTAGLLASVPQIVMSFRNYNPTRFSYLANDWYQPLYALLARSPRILFSGNSRASNADYAQWMGIDEHRVKLVPNAIDVSGIGNRDIASLQRLRQELGVTSRTPIILGVFRLSEEKRPLLFVEAFAAVAAELPDARAFIAGVGLFEEQIRRRVEELGLQNSLSLLGRRDDVPELMQISSVLLLTSSFEGMPNVLMEAQAVSLAVVASNVGGVPDCMIDGETGYLVAPDDIDGFARRCVELLKDDRLRSKFGASGAAYMRNSFSRRAMAERYLQILQDGVAESHTKPELRAAAA
jgi:glycosyltransferase involved in cell wall biosynthesis